MSRTSATARTVWPDGPSGGSARLSTIGRDGPRGSRSTAPVTPGHGAPAVRIDGKDVEVSTLPAEPEKLGVK